MKERIDSSDLEDIPPEILKYVLEEEESDNQDLDNSTIITTTQASGALDDEIIIEGEFLETGEDSCSNRVSYQVLDSKTYSMESEEGETGTSATIIFQEVLVEGETKVNFGESFTVQRLDPVHH